MSTRHRFALNVIMNWIAMAVAMVVPFFLTPLVVKHLGATAYGIWILAISTVGYLNLLDLGLRSAIIRFVSKAQTQGRVDEAQDAISAALWFRSLISSAVVVISIILTFVFVRWFKIPPDMKWAAQITILMCSLGVANTLVSGVFGAVLAAMSRYDILSLITVSQTVLRALGVIFILRSNRGLISIALWDFTVGLLTGLATWLITRKLYPISRVKIQKPNMQTFKMLWSYSFTMFIIIISAQVVFSTDNLVIGSFLSVGLVSFYSIGGSLTVYSRQIVSAMSTTFTPMASSLEAAGRMDDLQKLLMRGTQASLGLALPISLALLFRGKTFIGLWMGQQYATVSGTVLQILMISQFFTVANVTAANIMFATGKHKAVAKCASIEALLNFCLSVFLVRKIGIYGVAWGTSITMLLVHLSFWPAYVQRALNVPAWKYIWSGWGKITASSIPFGIACALADRHWHASSLLIYFSQILITLPIYVIAVALVFHKESKALVMKWYNRKAELKLAPDA